MFHVRGDAKEGGHANYFVHFLGCDYDRLKAFNTDQPGHKTSLKTTPKSTCGIIKCIYTSV